MIMGAAGTGRPGTAGSPGAAGIATHEKSGKVSLGSLDGGGGGAAHRGSVDPGVQLAGGAAGCVPGGHVLFVKGAAVANCNKPTKMARARKRSIFMI
jgi:hypothetical protein